MEVRTEAQRGCVTFTATTEPPPTPNYYRYASALLGLAAETTQPWRLQLMLRAHVTP